MAHIIDELRSEIRLYDDWPPSDVPVDAVRVIDAARRLVQTYDEQMAYVEHMLKEPAVLSPDQVRKLQGL